MSNGMKKRAVRFVLSLISVILLAVTLISCGERKSAEELFSTFRNGFGTLPSGNLFSTALPSSDDRALSEEILTELYVGEGAISSYIDEGVVYLSSNIDAFGEVGLFVCGSHSDAVAVSKICLARIESVREMTRGYESESVGRALDGAYVKIYGSCCVYSMLEGNERSKRCFDRML